MPATRINSQDEAHLRLISVFHFVLAGIYLLGIGFVVIHFLFMRFALEMAQNAPPPAPVPKVAVIPGEAAAIPVAPAPAAAPPATAPEIPDELLWFMGAIYLVMGSLLIAQCVCNILSGLWIAKRKKRMFSFIVAGINCMFFPLGTALGVFTFVVLSRLGIAAVYEERK